MAQGTLTSNAGYVTIGVTPNDTITITPTSGTYTLEYPIGTVLASGASTTATYTLGAGQCRLQCVTGTLTWLTTDVADTPTLSASQVTAVQSLVARAGNAQTGLLLDGDSLSARNSNELQVTSLTRSGTVGSVTASALSSAVGAVIRIGNVTNDPNWNGNYVVTGFSGTTATFACGSDLSTPASTTRSQITVNVLTQKRADGDLVWAEMLNGVNYAFTANVAIGGRVLTEILADFDTLGPGLYSGCLIDFCGGTNDPKNGVATTVSSAAMEAYIIKAIVRGHRVLINTVAPLAGAANTSDVQVKTLALNAEYRRLAALYKQPLYDKYAALVDPATAAIKSGNFDTSDNIHVTPTGCRIAGTGKAAVYTANLPWRPVAIPGTISDTIGVIAGSANILDGFFAGTGGTGGAGSVATNWTLTPTTLTVTGSKGAGSVGATQVLTLSGASGSFTFIGPSVHASVVGGATYEFVGKVALANFAAGIRITLGMTMTVNGAVGEVRALSTVNSTQPMPTGALNITFRSEAITVPVGSSVTNMRPSVVVVTTAVPGGTETVTLESFAINRLT